MMSTATINAFHTKNRIVPSRSCSYRAKTECPTSGNCRKESVVYPATVSQSIITLPKATWTERKILLKPDIQITNPRFLKQTNATIPSLVNTSGIWRKTWQSLKSSGGFCNIQPRPTAGVTCLWEKYFIICKPDLALLNKRNELISSCRHTSKYALENFTPKVLFLFLLLCFVLFSYTFSCHAIQTQFFENVATVARAFQLNQPAKVNSRSVILSDEFKTPVVLYQTL